MGTIIIPQKVLTKLTAIARIFFWGGKHDKRSLAYVSWDVITAPKGMGGLGLRSLKETNQALVLKAILRLAMGSDAQWAQAIRAKYFSRGAFWTIQRRTRCSKLWKQIVDLRPILENHIAWKIGSGESISVYSQPWLPGWKELHATTAQQRGQKASSLLDSSTRTWNFEALQELLGFNSALRIATMDSIQPSPDPANDTLIFTF